MVLNCIIVDDERVSRVSLKALVDKSSRLNLLGVAENGREALDLVNTHDIDLVLLDVSMPIMNGFEFLDNLERRKNLHVILVTADKEYALKAFDYNITDYLLKPVSWMRFNQGIDRVISALTQKVTDGLPSNFLLLKQIRFMHTRNFDVLEPVSDRNSLIGYSYGLLTESLDFDQQFHALDILEEAERDGIFSGSLEDVIYLCSNCSNNYLNIRESCPKCGSVNLKPRELVHHFSCAYMGPEDEFKSNSTDDLICPKCSKKLKHIGVDYDKPSSVFSCRNCDNLFQDPLLKAKCKSCGSENKVEHLERKVIKKYTLTAKGKEMAKGNFYQNAQQPSSQETNGMDQNKYYFQRVVKSEINRKSKADFESTLGIVTLMNIEILYERIGKEGKSKLLSELFHMLTNTLSGSDELMFRDNESIVILFPERGTDEAVKQIKQLNERLRELFRDNFDGFELDIEHAVLPITEGKDYNEHVTELTNMINKSNNLQ